MTLPWMAAKILLRPVAELRPHTGNARIHSAAQLEQIKASMLAFGFTNPLLVDEAGVLIAGHGRLEAATALGMAKVPVIVLRHLSAAQKEALRLADNRIAENATWDQALLRDALAAVQAVPDIDLGALGFSADELADILAAAGDAVSDGDAPEALSADPAEGGGAAGAVATGEEAAEDPADADPVPPRQAVTRPGDLWLLGDHRLLCGDSTDAASVARVMGEDRAALLFTSPPYGNQRDYTTGGVSDWDALMQGVFQHLDAALRPDGQGSQHYWCGARDQGNVWHFDKPARNDLHPTMKPVALVERAIRNSSKPRDTVLDCFGGSGTTMIAAERTGRRAVLLEIDPAYADVIVQRWQEATGEAAVLDGDDRIFADVASARGIVDHDVIQTAET